MADKKFEAGGKNSLLIPTALSFSHRIMRIMPLPISSGNGVLYNVCKSACYILSKIKIISFLA